MKNIVLTGGVCVALTAAVLAPGGAAADPAADPMMSKLVGKTVFLDPGHQGTGHRENLTRPVNDGRGGTKECQTTGMTTLGGVPEHTITWNVAQLVKASLETLGATVQLSRADDTGWGGCVDERAAAASKSGADVALSIHADSAPATDHGFHLIVPALPIPDPKVNEVQSGKGLDFSEAMRDAYVKSGFVSANYAGVVDGLQTRADIAGPALTTVPLAFIEMGNGANSEDAPLLETEDGQVKQAIAITTGIVGYLLGNTSPSPGTDVRGTPPSANPTNPGTAQPGTTKPQAQKSTPATPGDRKEGGTLDSVLGMLSPLLGALGIGDEGSVDGEMVDLISQLANTLLDLVLNSDLLGGGK
jgi:N-acetylmuramoyl-L-alanine amidase